MKFFASLVLALVLPAAALADFTLRWQDNSNNELGFSVKRKVQGGTYGEVLRTGQNATVIVDPVVAAPGTLFCWTIDAFNNNLNGVEQHSLPSNEACKAIPQPSPQIPVLSVSSTSPTSIGLSWTAAGSSITLLQLRRRQTNSPLPGFEDRIVDLPLSSTSFVDAQVTTGVSYQYKLVAMSGSTYGETNVVTAVAATPIAAPVEPSNLTVQ